MASDRIPWGRCHVGYKLESLTAVAEVYPSSPRSGAPRIISPLRHEAGPLMPEIWPAYIKVPLNLSEHVLISGFVAQNRLRALDFAIRCPHSFDALEAFVDIKQSIVPNGVGYVWFGLLAQASGPVRCRPQPQPDLEEKTQ